VEALDTREVLLERLHPDHQHSVLVANQRQTLE